MEELLPIIRRKRRPLVSDMAPVAARVENENEEEKEKESPKPDEKASAIHPPKARVVA